MEFVQEYKYPGLTWTGPSTCWPPTSKVKVECNFYRDSDPSACCRCSESVLGQLMKVADAK